MSSDQIANEISPATDDTLNVIDVEAVGGNRSKAVLANPAIAPIHELARCLIQPAPCWR
jgi:hypothetical protein